MANRVVLCHVFVLAGTTACIQPAATRRGTSGAASGGRGLPLRYEGTCAHLACCSAYAVTAPPGAAGAYRCGAGYNGSCSHNVGWFAPAFTCDPSTVGRYRQPHDPPYLTCNDSDVWLSLPGLTRAECGARYVVCARGVRVLAVARDRSANNDSGKQHYEGSYGLLSALGADLAARESFVSIYAADDRDRIAADPACVAGL